MSRLVTGLFFPLLLFLKPERWSPPLRLQASHCSTFRIMCDVPGTTVFCNESIECFLGTASKFYFRFIIIIILVITFMHGIYNYIPETNRVSTVYSVAAVLYLQSVLPVMLFRLCNMFCPFTLALLAVCVQLLIWLFLQFLNFVLFRYVAEVLSECFWVGCSTPTVTRITFAYYYYYYYPCYDLYAGYLQLHTSNNQYF